jgi:hypothetical protein
MRKSKQKPIKIVDEIARKIVGNMTPLEIGKTLYPDAIPEEYSNVPEEVKRDHLTRYTEEELHSGQFFQVLPGKYTFIMSHESYSLLHNENNAESPREP